MLTADTLRLSLIESFETGVWSNALNFACANSKNCQQPSLVSRSEAMQKQCPRFWGPVYHGSKKAAG
jgi:hypothetical protein